MALHGILGLWKTLATAAKAANRPSRTGHAGLDRILSGLASEEKHCRAVWARPRVQAPSAEISPTAPTRSATADRRALLSRAVVDEHA